ncbi:MAG: Gfo/Idh/MocA family oxidoreductase [Phycisphaerae bacterium]|nr:Gfo/Idh/MocA family oxidoreductase [Phycisphaerae bacterium]
MAKPKVAFAGTGWIGRNRLQAIVDTAAAEVIAIADPSHEMRSAAQLVAPGAECYDSFDALLGGKYDAVVIATPSAMHAEQAIAVLKSGAAVFCQKPLGRTAAETAEVVETARATDKLLAVDFSYRHVRAMQAVYACVRAGDIGEVYAAELVFHNAYGPDKAWFYDPAQSGGGCVIDLGIHMADLALWVMDSPEIVRCASHLMAKAKQWDPQANGVEDYAVAQLTTATGAVINLACSWNLPAGCDAVIKAAFYGTKGAAAFTNIDGSFFNFAAYRHEGTHRQVLYDGPDEWFGRAGAEFARSLAQDSSFNAAAEEVTAAARVIDMIYNR